MVIRLLIMLAVLLVLGFALGVALAKYGGEVRGRHHSPPPLSLEAMVEAAESVPVCHFCGAEQDDDNYAEGWTSLVSPEGRDVWCCRYCDESMSAREGAEERG